jgi:hypothetical protein
MNKLIAVALSTLFAAGVALAQAPAAKPAEAANPPPPPAAEAAKPAAAAPAAKPAEAPSLPPPPHRPPPATAKPRP